MELSTALSLLAALYSDRSDFGRAQLARVLAVLAEKPPIPGIVERLVATPRWEGGFDHVNVNITGANFPVTTEPRLEGAQLDEIIGSDKHILAVLRSMGRRASNGAETLLYGTKNPGEQTKYRIWGLGQLWVDPRNGRMFAVVLGLDDVKERFAYLGDIADGLSASSRVLSFPMSVEELAQRDAEDAARHSD